MLGRHVRLGRPAPARRNGRAPGVVQRPRFDHFGSQARDSETLIECSDHPTRDVVRCRGDRRTVCARASRSRRRGTIPSLVHDDDQVRAWVTHVVIPRLECWLAKRASGTIVGMLALEAEEIDELYVDPDLRRLGIGAELIAVAKRERPGRLQLWTFVSNEDAQRFYLRHGFQEVQRTDGSRNEERAPDIQYAWVPA